MFLGPSFRCVTSIRKASVAAMLPISSNITVNCVAPVGAGMSYSRVRFPASVDTNNTSKASASFAILATFPSSH